MGKAERDKGKRGELKTVKSFRRVYPDCDRNLSETRDGGTGIDLIGTGNLAVQVKTTKRYLPVTRINEIKPPNGEKPLLVLNADYKPPIAVMYLDDLLDILEDVITAYE